MSAVTITSLLYDFAATGQWQHLIERVKTHPEEAKYICSIRDFTPLHAMFAYSNETQFPPLNAVKALTRLHVKVGAKFEVRDGCWTPLHYAVSRGRLCSVEIITCLLEESRERIQLCLVHDHAGSLPLHVACRSGCSVDVLRALVSFSPSSVHRRTKISGMTPWKVLYWHEAFNVRDIVTNVFSEKNIKNETLAVQVRELFEKVTALLWTDNDSQSMVKERSELYQMLNILKVSDLPTLFKLMIVKAFGPHQSSLRSWNDKLPLHYIVESKILCSTLNSDVIISLIAYYPEAVKLKCNDGKYPLVRAIECGLRWEDGLQHFYEAAPLVATTMIDKINLYPFMIASIGVDPCLNSIFNLLQRSLEPSIFEDAIKRYSTCP